MALAGEVDQLRLALGQGARGGVETIDPGQLRGRVPANC
jgi:hypothetical protein